MTSTSTDRRFGVNSSMAIKVPCKAATTANITLSGAQTIDGVSCVTDDRVLVKNQTTGANNGIYVVDSGSWTRALDFDGTYDVVRGTSVYITQGTANAGLFYAITTSDPITIGSTSIAFGVVSPSSSITLPLAVTQGGTGGSSAISGLANLGVIQVTGEAGTANAQTGTIDALVTSLRADQLFIFVPSIANTSAMTITLTPSGSSALPAKNVFANGVACLGGEMSIGVPTILQYDGTQLQIVGNANQRGSFRPASGTGKNIAARTDSVSPNSKLNITADELIVSTTTGNGQRLSSVSLLAIDITTSGANGLDTGAEGSSTWYYGWVIAKEDGTVAGLLSTSSSAPTMPSGYTYKALVTAVRNDGSSNFIKYRQFGNEVFYEAGTNTALNGGSATVETAVSTATLVPPNALTVRGALQCRGVGTVAAQRDTLQLRLISGGSYFASALSTCQVAGVSNPETVPFNAPNIGQNFYYIFLVAEFGTSHIGDIFIEGFKLPLGGE